MADGVEISDNGPAPGRRFAAFLSYSHVDAVAAAKLQRKLEQYRLPKQVARQRDGATSLGPIFRDREDFAAATSLSDAIREAIAQADSMVVLCSPDAAASPWVRSEIELFRQLHPARPILAALLSSEPTASFPAALTENGLEPLAADLRPEGDGKQLGFLKIVAGIAGVPLDELIQRDAQRRIRRVTAITGGALAAMLVMAIMTGYAISARNEAARQRAASDGLVEYMLTDLRENLKGVGRPEVMDAVNKRALDHYASQGDPQLLPADSLEHRARVLHAMGDDDVRDGYLGRALKRFKEAHMTTATLLARDPGDPDRIFAHAQSEYYIGRVAMNKKDRVTASRHWQGYLQQATALAKAEPDSFRSAMELGYAEGNLCELTLVDRFDLAAAEGHCARAIKHEENALRAKPGDATTRQDIANRWGWLARVQMARGDSTGAIVSRTREIEMMDRLIADDRLNVEYALRRSWAINGLAWAYLPQGRSAEAIPILKKEIQRFERTTLSATGDLRVSATKMRLLVLLSFAEQKAAGKASPKTREALSLMLSGPSAKMHQQVYDSMLRGEQ